jgi:alcohol dehydrogenase class IV
MVNDFLFAPTPHIIFGRDKIKQLPGIISGLGHHVLIVLGGSSYKNTGWWQDTTESLKKEGITYQQVNLEHEPSPAFIDGVVKDYAGTKIEVVVSIGGGSVIDAGKAISAMLGRKESVKIYLEGIGTKKPDGSKIPFIAVPTTSGTGSEATKNAVMSEIGRYGFKKSLRHDNFVPDYAIIDPALTLSCPAHLTAACGLDAFTQLLESYVSDKASPMTDSLAFKGLECVAESLVPLATTAGKDYHHRSNMSFAALMSGICLANAGLGVVHGFASPIGGLFSIPHGVVCGTLMGVSTQYTIEKLLESGEDHPALEKYANTGKLFVPDTHKSNRYYAESLAHSISNIVDSLQIPRLSEFGVTKNDIPGIAAKSGNKNNPVKFQPEELENILLERL